MRRLWPRPSQCGCFSSSCTVRHGLGRPASYGQSNAHSLYVGAASSTRSFTEDAARDRPPKGRITNYWEDALSEQAVKVDETSLQAQLPDDAQLRARVGTRWDAPITIDAVSAARATRKAARKQEIDTGARLWHYHLQDRHAKMPFIPRLDKIKASDRAPQSLWAHPRVAELRRAPWCGKKTYVVELCVLRLVLDLCLATGLYEQTGHDVDKLPLSIQPIAALSRTDIAYAQREIEIELTALYGITNEVFAPTAKISLCVALPSFPDAADQFTTELNDGLKRACAQKQPYDADFVARISSYLLRSRGRPDIETIDTLLLAFIGHGRYDLATPMLDLNFDGHFRPTELTCAAVLRCYRQSAQPDLFIEYIGRMNGQGSGIMLATPLHLFKTEPTERGRSRLIPKGEKLIQAVTPSSLVYLEAILGMLRFTGLRQTWQFCTDSAMRGWGFDYACIYVLLFQSAVDSVHEIAQRVWADARELASRGFVIPKSLYALMIAMYKLDSDQHGSWELFKEFVSQNPKEEEESLVALVQERVQLIAQTRLVDPDQRHAAQAPTPQIHDIIVDLARGNALQMPLFED